VIGKLSWTKAQGTLAEAAWHDRKMTLKRGGLWKPVVSIRTAEQRDDIASIKLHWLHDSTLVFTKGISYGWKFISIWRQEWGFVKSGGSPVLTFNANWTMSGLTIDVNVVDAAGADDRLPLLIIFGCYLLASTYGSDGDDTAVLAAVMG